MASGSPDIPSSGPTPLARSGSAGWHARRQINGESTTDDVDDPLAFLEEALARYQSQSVPGVHLPRFVGGAVGYLSYEAVRAFEPRVGLAAGPGLWVSRSRTSCWSIRCSSSTTSAARSKSLRTSTWTMQPDVETAYAAATARIDELVAQLRKPMPVLPHGGEPVDNEHRGSRAG